MEVKIFNVLTSQFSGSGEAFQTSFPQTSRKRGFKSQAAQDESMSGKSMNSVNKAQDKGNGLINRDQAASCVRCSSVLFQHGSHSNIMSMHLKSLLSN